MGGATEGHSPEKSHITYHLQYFLTSTLSLVLTELELWCQTSKTINYKQRYIESIQLYSKNAAPDKPFISKNHWPN